MKFLRKRKIQCTIFILFIILISFSFAVAIYKEMGRDVQNYVKVDDFSACAQVGLENKDEYIVIVGDDPYIVLPQIAGDYLEIIVKFDDVIENGGLSIYYDTGGGFSETFHEMMDQKLNQEYSIKIKPYINSIRIDFDGFPIDAKITLESVEAIRDVSAKEKTICIKLIIYLVTTIGFVLILILKKWNISSMLVRTILFYVCEKEMIFDLQDINSVYYTIWFAINICLVLFIALYSVGEKNETED